MIHPMPNHSDNRIFGIFGNLRCIGEIAVFNGSPGVLDLSEGGPVITKELDFGALKEL